MRYSFLLTLISSSFFLQLQLLPTSIRRGSSTEIWSQKTLWCSRERREWVKDPAEHLVMTNTPKPQQRGHIQAVCVWVLWNKCRRLVSSRIHMFTLNSWAQLCCTEYLIWKPRSLLLILALAQNFLGLPCSEPPLRASLYFLRYVTNHFISSSSLQQDTGKWRMLHKWGQTY